MHKETKTGHVVKSDKVDPHSFHTHSKLEMLKEKAEKISIPYLDMAAMLGTCWF